MFPVGRKFDTVPQIRRIESRARGWNAARDALVKCTHVVAPQYTTGVISLLFPALTRCGRGSREYDYIRVYKGTVAPRVCTRAYSRILLVEMHTYREYSSLSVRAYLKRAYKLERKRLNAQFSET